MPDLMKTLQGHDLGFLNMIAAAWGIELNAPDAATALPILVREMIAPVLVVEILESLPADTREVLQALYDQDARMPWAKFERTYGPLRVIGAGKRDRERPDLNPISPVERLWYRGLIGKAFLNLPPEPQEYAYIPDDLLDFMTPLGARQAVSFGRPATPVECNHISPAQDRILDRCCTLLAALRLGIKPAQENFPKWDIPLNFLMALLKSAGLITSKGMPEPEAVRKFLEANRASALALLARNWLNSATLNDLRLLPGFIFEGEWQNNPLQTRQTVIGFLSHLPQETWWSLNAFIAAIHDRHPDFQRPAGDYDSWFIRQEKDDTYLRGFASWDAVDGALLRFLISGPLHWLGIIDLASASPNGVPTAFRSSIWASALWYGTPPPGLPAEKDPLRVTSDGRLLLTPHTPRSVRYQIARFAVWEKETPTEFRYRLTPESMTRAQDQGLRTAHLISLLRKHGPSQLPPGLIQALERWEKTGSQVSIEQVQLLRVSSAEILSELRKTRAARYLGQAITPNIVIVQPRGIEAIRNALFEMGYLTEFILESGTPSQE